MFIESRSTYIFMKNLQYLGQKKLMVLATRMVKNAQVIKNVSSSKKKQ